MEILAIILVSVFIVKMVAKAQARSRGHVAACSVNAPEESRAYEREQEKRRKEALRQEKSKEKARKDAEKIKASKKSASSDLEFIRHRLEQIDDLIEIANNQQDGTNRGSTEWLKYEREIMRLEAQAHALKKKHAKAISVLNS